MWSQVKKRTKFDFAMGGFYSDSAKWVRVWSPSLQAELNTDGIRRYFLVEVSQQADALKYHP